MPLPPQALDFTDPAVQAEFFEQPLVTVPARRKLVGLHGVAESGKDTVCQMLDQQLRGELVVKRDGFADRLKMSAARALGQIVGVEDGVEFCNQLKSRGVIRWVVLPKPVVTPEGRIDDWDPQYGEISGREYLQYYGTEAHREVFDEDFWIKAVIPDYADPDFGRADYFDVLVITDVRFPNEAEAIRAAGGKVWLIWRPDKQVGDQHASEKPLSDDLIDWVIDNSKDFDHLRTQVELAWSHIDE